MTTTRTATLIAFSMLVAAGSAGAQSDSLRCQARQMRAESAYFHCLSRCDRRAERAAAQLAGRQDEGAPADCETICAGRYDDDLARIGGTAPCAVAAPEPSPRDCEAHALRLSASLLHCAARCGRPHRRADFDETACLATCQTRCDTSLDQLAADPMCGAGRIGRSVVCALQ